MHFQDAQADDLEGTLLDIVESVLTDGFNSAPHAATFAKFGGVRITRKPEEGLEWYTKSKRPFLFLQLESADPAGWQTVQGGQLMQGTRHDVTIAIEAITNESCAFIEAPLRIAVKRILDAAYPRLRDAGLENNKARALRPDEKPDRRNPFEITATAFSIP